jgi:hypothetical protein
LDAGDDPKMRERADLLVKRTRRVWILSVLLFALVANLGVLAFVTHERAVYFWDWGGYWRRVQSVTETIDRLLGVRNDTTGVSHSKRAQRDVPDEGNPDSILFHGLERLTRSVWNDNYNVVPTAPLLPWTLIFGAERLSYVLAVVNLYAMPAAILLCIFCYRYPLRIGALDDHWRIWVPLTMIAGFPLFWAPIVRGMLDVGILACNLLVLLLYFSRPLKELRLPALLTMGLLLAFSVVFRRWNAYWAVSFLVVVGFDGLAGFIASQDRSAVQLLAHLRPSLVAGGSALAVLLLGAAPLVVRMTTTDYADIYEAYKFEDGVVPVLSGLGGGIGYLWIGFFILSAAALIWKRETRRLALVLTAQWVIVVVLFARTSSFGVQHYYLLQAGVLIVCSLAVLQIMAFWSSTWSRGIALALMVVVAVSIDLSTFVPRAAPLHTWLQPAVPRETYYPLVRHDVAELNRLYAALDGLLGSEERFYVLSATEALNDTHFIRAHIRQPFEFDAADRLLRTQNVDKRDGFPRNLLDADVVILASPVGGKGEFSQVLLEPARLIKDGIGLGRAFVRLPYEFHLDNNVTARVFERMRPFTEAEIQALSDHLRRLYPDYPKVYEPDYDGR